jgi:hypothetical protein
VLETANDVFFFSISIQVPIFLITANNKRRFFLQNQTTKNWADVILESCCQITMQTVSIEQAKNIVTREHLSMCIKFPLWVQDHTI